MLSRVVLLTCTSNLVLHRLKPFSKSPPATQLRPEFPLVAWPARPSWFGLLRAFQLSVSPSLLTRIVFVLWRTAAVFLVPCGCRALYGMPFSAHSPLTNFSSFSSVQLAFHLPFEVFSDMEDCLLLCGLDIPSSINGPPCSTHHSHFFLLWRKLLEVRYCCPTFVSSGPTWHRWWAHFGRMNGKLPETASVPSVYHGQELLQSLRNTFLILPTDGFIALPTCF